MCSGVDCWLEACLITLQEFGPSSLVSANIAMVMKPAGNPQSHTRLLDPLPGAEFIELLEDSDRRRTKFQGFFITRVRGLRRATTSPHPWVLCCAAPTRDNIPVSIRLKARWKWTQVPTAPSPPHLVCAAQGEIERLDSPPAAPREKEKKKRKATDAVVSGAAAPAPLPKPVKVRRGQTACGARNRVPNRRSCVACLAPWKNGFRIHHPQPLTFHSNASGKQGDCS